MKRRQLAVLVAAASAVAVSVTMSVSALSGPAQAGDDTNHTFAVIGDIPYGANAIAAFPGPNPEKFP